MRNIVLIGTDSVRADHCSCYGYNRKTTPFIDRLAEDGIKFENSIVSGLATPASFLGIFTGDYSPVESESIGPSYWKNALNRRKTLAEVLSKKGYNTYGFNLNALLSKYYGFNKGFQYYFDWLWSGATKDGEHSWWWKFKKFYLLPLLKKKGLAGLATNMKNFIKADKGYASSEDWIDKVYNTKLKEPYFLWIFLVDTHHPYVPPSKYSRWSKTGTRRMCYLNYKMKKLGKGEINSNDTWTMRQQKLQPKLKREEHEAIVNGYDGEILHVDSIVKELWEHLKDTDPIFIFHSDHGDGFREHGFYGHPPEHYEGLIRVPLLIYNADRKGVIEEPVSFLRLAPTICDLAGVDNEFPQPSLLDDTKYSPPIVENKLEEGFRVTVRDRDWKLIVNPDRDDELYNIKKDALEQENLIGKEKEVEHKLRGYIENHRKIKEAERLRKNRNIEKIK